MYTYVELRPFEIYIDPVMPEVSHFCLPDLLPLLKQTVGSLNEVSCFNVLVFISLVPGALRSTAVRGTRARFEFPRVYLARVPGTAVEP